MFRIALIVITISTLLFSFEAFAQSRKIDPDSSKKNPLETKYAKGLVFTASDSSFSVKTGFRFQSLVAAETETGDMENVKGRAMIRRSRLKFDGFAFNPDVVYKLELGFSNSDQGAPLKEGNNAASIIYDAVVKWKAFKNTSIWFGQTKLPGNRERVISSQAMQFVDRSAMNALYNIDRDMGFQLHSEFQLSKMTVRHIYAISMGEGRNITADNIGGLEYTARVEFLPFGKFSKNGDYVGSDIYREPKPKLSLAASYDYNDDASRERGQLGKFLTSNSDLKTVFADLMFKYRGFSVMMEYADKKATKAFSYDITHFPNGTFITGRGLNIQSGYLFKNNWEIAGRYTEVNPAKTTGRNDEYHYTLGVSRYVVGHNLKVQSDLSFIEEAHKNDDKLLLRLQVEVAF